MSTAASEKHPAHPHSPTPSAGIIATRLLELKLEKDRWRRVARELVRGCHRIPMELLYGTRRTSLGLSSTVDAVQMIAQAASGAIVVTIHCNVSTLSYNKSKSSHITDIGAQQKKT
jgi:hypothetical protein